MIHRAPTPRGVRAQAPPSLPRTVQSLLQHAVVVWGLILPIQLLAQPTPLLDGDRRDVLRDQTAVAQRCFDLLDFRCVISQLEGPLLIQDDPPPDDMNLTPAYEILGLAYLALDFPEQSRRAFRTLLQRDPNYRLQRGDVPARQRRFVELIIASFRAQRDARHIARHLLLKAAPFSSRLVIAAALAQAQTTAEAKVLAQEIVRRSHARVAAILDAPWGPLRGPFVSVAFAFRILTGSDRDAWTDGPGLRTAFGVRYQPFEAHLFLQWTQHTLNRNNPVLQLSPLDVVTTGAHLGWVYEQAPMRYHIGVELGVEFLTVANDLKTIAPVLGLAPGLSRMIQPQLWVEAHTHVMWALIANSPNSEDTITSSLSIIATLGLRYTFE